MNVEIYANTPPSFNTDLTPFPTNITWTFSNSTRTIPIPPPVDVDSGQTLRMTVTMIDGSALPTSLIEFD